MATGAGIHRPVHFLHVGDEKVRVAAAPHSVSVDAGLYLLNKDDKVFPQDFHLMEHDQPVHAIGGLHNVDHGDHASGGKNTQEQDEAYIDSFFHSATVTTCSYTGRPSD